MSSHFDEVVEEYMETLFDLHHAADPDAIRTGDLAEAMEVSPASATEMVQRLAERDLLTYERYKGVRLTPEGLDFARRMKRRHRLAQTFLERLLGYTGDIEEAACRLEHAIDPELEATIDQLLGHPDETPAGEPIPREGSTVAPATDWVALAALSDGQSGTVEALILPPEVAEVLARAGVGVGTSVVRRDDAWWHGEDEVRLAPELADRVLIRRS